METKFIEVLEEIDQIESLLIVLDQAITYSYDFADENKLARKEIENFIKILIPKIKKTRKALDTAINKQFTN